MANLSVNGMDALIGDMTALAALPNDVIDGILNAEADIIEAEQRKTAREMGVYDTGMTASSIKKGRVERTAGETKIFIYPRGKNQHGDRNAEVAFINEYGKRGQTARPFIRTSNERAADGMVEAGEKVLNAYLDSKRL